MYENSFTPKVEDGLLNFIIGQQNGDSSKIPVNNNVEGELKGTWSWELSKVITILRLSDSSNCVVSFSEAGAMQIDIDSGIGAYTYILPARS